MAGASIAALVVLYAAALRTGLGLTLDRWAIARVDPVTDPRAYKATSTLLSTIDITSLVLLGGGLVLLALLRAGPRLALAVAAVVLGANVTTQVLKPLLGAAESVGGDTARVLEASFPSGHATVAMSLALALVLVVPPALRPAAALLGTGYAIGVAVAVVALGWHYPSDVAGAFLVAGAWGAGVAGALMTRGHARSGGSRRSRTSRAPKVSPAVLLAAAGWLGAAVAAVLLLAVLRRPDLVSLVRLHTLFFVSVGALGLLALVISGGIAFLLRSAERA